MSDELWVSRGEYGSVVRGTGLPGALPQLLRTPGLVACYLPYLDVVGRNVLSVGREDFQTGWSGTFTPSISGPDSDGWYSMSWGSGLNGKYWRTSTAPFACNALASIEVQVLSGAFVLGDASARLFNINATDYSLPTTVSFTSQPYNNSIIYLSIITWDYGGCSMKIRAPRLNLGQSYPYSAPVGLPQVLTDFSGHGNHAQLGSTSGVDTNDPTWGDKYLDFNGIDQYLSSAPEAVTTWSLLGDPYGNALGWVQGKRTNVAGRLYAELRFNRVPTEAERIWLFHNVQTLLAGQGVTGTFYDWAYPIPCTTGVMDFSLKNGADRLWVAPDGTTSTAEKPAFNLGSNGTTWAYLSNWDGANLEINHNTTGARYVGDIADIPPVVLYFVEFVCPNLTGDITNFRSSYRVRFENCTKLTGDISNIRPSYYYRIVNNPNLTGDISNIRPSYYASFAHCPNVTGTLNPQATLKYIYLQSTGLNTTQLDNSIIAVADVTTVVGAFYWSTGVRSSASDAAYDSLSAKGWTLTAREW